MKNLFVIITLLLWSLNINSMVVVVKDKLTNKPIPLAFVYKHNSTEVTYTDESGVAEINTNHPIISYYGYSICNKHINNDTLVVEMIKTQLP
jgi:hypothetical protein